MPQHDGIIDNQAGAAFRADLNNFILAIIANSSGATAPATTYAYQWWADTTTGLLKIRNAANSGWITVGTLADAYLGLLPLSGGTLTGLLTFKKGADIASAATVNLTAATGNLLHISGTTATSAVTMNSGQVMLLIADAAWPLTYHATNNKINSGGANVTLAAGDMVLYHSDGTTVRGYIIKADGTAVVSSAVLRGYLDGCTMSTAGSSATMSVAAGSAVDSGNTALMELSAISKTTGAWAVGTGNGGLDTGAIANSTWYHFFVIKRTDTGVVDVLISLSATAPTMPTNYTLKRRIGSGKTNGAGQWTSFTQVGDVFDWADPVVDVDAQNPGTAAVTRTLTVPTGVAVQAKVVTANHHGSTAQVGNYISPLHATDTAPQANATVALGAPITFLGTNTGTAAWIGGPVLEILTNTSAQIRSRLNVSGAADRIGIITLGWIDARGRNA